MKARPGTLNADIRGVSRGKAEAQTPAARLAALAGLWCLGQAAASALFHSQYAAHEFIMGISALAVSATCAMAAQAWRAVARGHSSPPSSERASSRDQD